MMHIETDFNLDRMVRTHRVLGSINLTDFTECLAKIYSAPEFNPDFDSLWDLREADFSSISVEDVRSLMAIVKLNWQKNGKRRAAIVVSGMAEFGIAQVYAQHFGSAGQIEIMTFMDTKAVWNWFGKKQPRS